MNGTASAGDRGGWSHCRHPARPESRPRRSPTSYVTIPKAVCDSKYHIPEARPPSRLHHCAHAGQVPPREDVLPDEVAAVAVCFVALIRLSNHLRRVHRTSSRLEQHTGNTWSNSHFGQVQTTASSCPGWLAGWLDVPLLLAPSLRFTITRPSHLDGRLAPPLEHSPQSMEEDWKVLLPHGLYHLTADHLQWRRCGQRGGRYQQEERWTGEGVVYRQPKRGNQGCTASWVVGGGGG